MGKMKKQSQIKRITANCARRKLLNSTIMRCQDNINLMQKKIDSCVAEKAKLDLEYVTLSEIGTNKLRSKIRKLNKKKNLNLPWCKNLAVTIVNETCYPIYDQVTISDISGLSILDLHVNVLLYLKQLPDNSKL